LRVFEVGFNCVIQKVCIFTQDFKISYAVSVNSVVEEDILLINGA
jgi:hypothetical protein